MRRTVAKWELDGKAFGSVNVDHRRVYTTATAPARRCAPVTSFAAVCGKNERARAETIQMVREHREREQQNIGFFRSAFSMPNRSVTTDW